MTPAEIDVLILAGGAGTRARSYLGDTPKLLAPVAGVPLIHRLLSYLVHQRLRRVVLALGHGHEPIIDHLSSRYLTERYPVEVVWTIDQPEPTQGQLSAIQDATRSGSGLVLSDPFIVMNGDTLVSLDLPLMLQRYGVRYGHEHLTAVDGTGASLGVHAISLSAFNRLSGWPVTGYPYVTTRPWVDVGTVEGYERAQRLYRSHP